MKIWEIRIVNNNSGALRYANIVFFALTVVVNGIAGGTTLIGGQLTAAVSDANPNLVTPAGQYGIPTP